MAIIILCYLAYRYLLPKICEKRRTTLNTEPPIANVEDTEVKLTDIIEEHPMTTVKSEQTEQEPTITLSFRN